MDLSNLNPNKGSVKSKKKRIGRGQGSGKGGTATRGHKGAQSRSGYSRKLGFEGGQMPLQRRIPKFGFKNINRVEYKPVNLNSLQLLVDNKKIKKKTIDILFTDIKQCFDSIWLDKATNDLYDSGVVFRNLNLLYEGNSKTRMCVETNFGRSERVELNKVVMQNQYLRDLSALIKYAKFVISCIEKEMYTCIKIKFPSLL